MSFGKTIRGALSYNEHKVRDGSAELILASHFSRDIDEMGFSEKLLRFEKLNQLSEKTKTNTLHIVLSFSPDDAIDPEKDAEKLRLIGMEYMDRIGFGNQPFLIYQHKDTGHPHLHIVTNTIRSNGKPIYLHNLAKRKSEPARKAIEIEYNLIKAEGRKQTSYLGTTAKISDTVSRVVQEYKFASLEEFNAILRQFNLIADRGAPDSFLYQKGGLLFCQIDKEGYKIGKAIKASAIYKSPTLSFLEKKFQRNSTSKLFYQKRMQVKIASSLAHASSSFEFGQILKNKNVGCSVQYGTSGEITNLSFVDHVSKTVFQCEDIGLTIPGILEKLNYHQNLTASGHQSNSFVQDNTYPTDPSSTSFPFVIIKTLLSSDHYQPEISPEFFKKKKKRRKH